MWWIFFDGLIRGKRFFYPRTLTFVTQCDLVGLFLSSPSFFYHSCTNISFYSIFPTSLNLQSYGYAYCSGAFSLQRSDSEECSSTPLRSRGEPQFTTRFTHLCQTAWSSGGSPRLSPACINEMSVVVLIFFDGMTETSKEDSIRWADSEQAVYCKPPKTT